MTTPLDIINQAMKKAGILGIGQNSLPEDTNDAFLDLNDMLAQWQRKRWLVYHLVDYSIVSTGATSYTVGPAANIVINPRPDKINAAFLRQINSTAPNQIDYPLELIDSYEDYSRISIKNLTSFPQYLFYDSGFPLGKIYPWPVALSTIYEIHIIVKETLSQFTTLTQSIILPLEYMAALKWNLAVRLRVAYQMPADNALVALAKDSLSVIRNANAQIPLLKMPKGLVQGGRYNWYSDQIK